MGKKARMKTIRKIAATLPTMQSPVYGKVLFSGTKAIEEGVETIQGVAVDPKKLYSKKTVTGSVDVNHNRRLRAIHTQLGIAGVKAYVQNINGLMERQLAKTV